MVFFPHLMLYTCVQIFDVMFLAKIFLSKQSLNVILTHTKKFQSAHSIQHSSATSRLIRWFVVQYNSTPQGNGNMAWYTGAAAAVTIFTSRKTGTHVWYGSSAARKKAAAAPSDRESVSHPVTHAAR
jgi:hypothetical protein